MHIKGVIKGLGWEPNMSISGVRTAWKLEREGKIRDNPRGRRRMTAGHRKVGSVAGAKPSLLRMLALVCQSHSGAVTSSFAGCKYNILHHRMNWTETKSGRATEHDISLSPSLLACMSRGYLAEDCGSPSLGLDADLS